MSFTILDNTDGSIIAVTSFLWTGVKWNAKLFHGGGRYHRETSPLICRAWHIKSLVYKITNYDIWFKFIKTSCLCFFCLGGKYLWKTVAYMTYQHACSANTVTALFTGNAIYQRMALPTADELFECAWPFCGVGS